MNHLKGKEFVTKIGADFDCKFYILYDLLNCMLFTKK